MTEQAVVGDGDRFVPVVADVTDAGAVDACARRALDGAARRCTGSCTSSAACRSTTGRGDRHAAGALRRGRRVQPAVGVRDHAGGGASAGRRRRRRQHRAAVVDQRRAGDAVRRAVRGGQGGDPRVRAHRRARARPARHPRERGRAGDDPRVPAAGRLARGAGAPSRCDGAACPTTSPARCCTCCPTWPGSSPGTRWWSTVARRPGRRSSTPTTCRCSCTMRTCGPACYNRVRQAT